VCNAVHRIREANNRAAIDIVRLYRTRPRGGGRGAKNGAPDENCFALTQPGIRGDDAAVLASRRKFRLMGAAMNVPSTRPVKSPLLPCARRAAIALLAFATILAPPISPTATAAPQASTLADLAKIREDWVQDLRTKQLEPILKFYAADAVFLQPTGERITGAAALRTLFQTIMATFNSDLTLHSQNLETSGDLAYDSGDFQETLTTIANGAKITAKGSYIIIYKRQPNGTWQIVQHVWTGTPPPGT